MNENARKLVAALRSGEFEQATGRLRFGNKFCCLGVACELYRREVGGEWECDTFLDSNSLLPPAVRNWVGFSDSEGGFGSDLESLASRNDEGRSFKEIADTVESEPEGLFV